MLGTFKTTFHELLFQIAISWEPNDPETRKGASSKSFFARTLMSAHLNNSLLAGVQEKREKLGADLAHPLGLKNKGGLNDPQLPKT